MFTGVTGRVRQRWEQRNRRLRTESIIEVAEVSEKLRRLAEEEGFEPPSESPH